MSRLDNIREQITLILRSVSGVGKVMHGIIYLRSQMEIERLTKNGIINAVGFIQTNNIPEIDESFDLENCKRRFFFVYYYGYKEPGPNVSENTFKTVETFSEKLQEAFNKNETLNSTVSGHNKLMLTGNNLVSSFTNKLIHMLTYELETYEEFEHDIS